MQLLMDVLVSVFESAWRLLGLLGVVGLAFLLMRWEKAERVIHRTAYFVLLLIFAIVLFRIAGLLTRTW